MPLLVPFEGPYQLLLTLGFLVGTTMAWRAGRQAGVAPLAWAVLLGAAASAGLIGSKIFFFDLQDSAPGEKTVLGGILLGVALVPLAAKALGLRIGQTLDHLTVPTLVAMAIGRVGCFLAGCCLGTHSAVLDARHPTVLYEAGLDLALVALLVQKLPARGGLRIGAGVLGYASIRFSTEFLRDGRVSYGALNAVQWFLLVSIAVAALWTLRALRREESVEPAREMADSHAAIGAGFVAVLTTMLVAAPSWLTPLEQFIIGGIALAVGTTGLWLLAPRPLGVVGIPALSALAIGAPFDTLPRAEVDIGIDAGVGGYERLLVDGGCDPSVFEMREFSVTQASIVRRKRQAGSWSAVSLLGAFGKDASRDGTSPSVPIRAVGLGWAATSEQAILSTRVLVGDVSNDGVAKRSAVPMVSLRVGRQRQLFGEYQYAPSKMFPTTGELSYIGLGLKFSSEHSRVFVGVGSGYVADLHLPIKDRFTLRIAGRSNDYHRRSLVRVGATWHLGGSAR